MSVDPKAMRYGDAVTVFGTFRGLDADGEIVVSISTLQEGMQRWAVDVREIATHDPRGIQSGDAVMFIGTQGARLVGGRVVHVWNELAWVDWDSTPFCHAILPLTKLERTND